MQEPLHLLAVHGVDTSMIKMYSFNKNESCGKMNGNVRLWKNESYFMRDDTWNKFNKRSGT